MGALRPAPSADHTQPNTDSYLLASQLLNKSSSQNFVSFVLFGSGWPTINSFNRRRRVRPATPQGEGLGIPAGGHQQGQENAHVRGDGAADGGSARGRVSRGPVRCRAGEDSKEIDDQSMLFVKEQRGHRVVHPPPPATVLTVSRLHGFLASPGTSIFSYSIRTGGGGGLRTASRRIDGACFFVASIAPQTRIGENLCRYFISTSRLINTPVSFRRHIFGKRLSPPLPRLPVKVRQRPLL